MSSPKFASVTADLLARKGEARPWTQDGATLDRPQEAAPGQAEFQEGVLRSAVRAPAPVGAPPERSCSLRMSARDYERLGIIAVKTGATRQQLLKQALAQYLESQAVHHGCACLGDCGNGCAPRN